MTAAVADAPWTSPRATPLWAVLRRVAVVALMVAAVGPTLTWPQFTSGSENLVVATALEIRRGGSWLVPTLQGEPRTRKPPLAAWFSAASLRQATLDALDSSDPLIRQHAYQQLAWQIRLPALLLACAGLLAVYQLGELVLGRGSGWLVALICGSSVFFLRYARITSTDVQLFAWVCIAQWLLAGILLRPNQPRWQGWTAAVATGAVLGMAILAKGPVALVQTVVPAALFALWQRPHDGIRCATYRAGTWRLLFACSAMLAIALPWFILVRLRYPAVAGQWLAEVTRHGATDMTANHWASHLIFLPQLMPWTAMLLVGIVLTLRTLRQGAQHATASARKGLALCLLSVVVPIVLMSLVRDRKDRYLLPMIGPAAVLAAFGMEQLRMALRRRPVLLACHWVPLLLIALGLPIAGTSTLKSADGIPWFSPWLAAGAIAISVTLLIFGWLATRRPGTRPSLLLWPALLVMLLLQALYMHGYSHSSEGRSDMQPLADSIRAVYPQAEVYYVRPDGKRKLAPLDLSIYLNRPVATRTDLPPGSGRTQVVVRVQRRIKGQLEPAPTLPAPWGLLQTLPRDGDQLHVFVRRPAP